MDIRQAAGLLLKNNLKTSISSYQEEYIKSELLLCLGATDRTIRSTALTVVVQLVGIFGWPKLLQELDDRLHSDELRQMENAMDAIYKICEDIPEDVDVDAPHISECLLNKFMPRLLQFFQSPHATLRKLSLGSINQFIGTMPTVLRSSMNQYLLGLFCLVHDPYADVRKLVCSAMVQLIEVQTLALEPYLKKVIDCMLLASKDSNEEIFQEACEFWSAYCASNMHQDGLRETLPQLIPILMSKMVYAAADECMFDMEDFESVNLWKLRKYSQACLCTLSNVYGNEILRTLLSLVKQNPSITSDSEWKEKAAAVFAISAIAEGCMNGLYPHLSEIVAFLLPFLDDKFSLIRSITCQTLSRYSKFVVQGIYHQNSREQFDKVLMGLFQKILDTDMRVQETACSAFATLGKEAAGELEPQLEIILQHLLHAFTQHQRRNLQIVYDAIVTLADAVGEELNQPKYLDILMHPLFLKFQGLSLSDKDLLPLFKCLISIAQALWQKKKKLWPGFYLFAEPVFKRCTTIIQMQQLMKAGCVIDSAQYDKEFIICSLNLLCELAKGLGSGTESPIAQGNLRDLLLHCCLDDAADIRLSAFALLGNLSRVCPVLLDHRLLEFLDAAANQLSAYVFKEVVTVANAACWAIGELAVAARRKIQPIVKKVILCLVTILKNAEGLNESLIKNSAITLGRIGWVCPELVAPDIEHFMQPWCAALCMIPDDYEKEDTFRGLCSMVIANPGGAVNSLPYMCKAIASLHEMSVDLYKEVCQVLKGYKQIVELLCCRLR